MRPSVPPVSTFTVPAEYARHIAEQLHSMGVTGDAWLLGTGVTRQDLQHPDRPLPYPAFRDLVRGALAASREPALGLFVGERLLASAHGMVGAVAVNSGTVLQALEMVQRFSALRSQVFTIEHEVAGSDGLLIFQQALPLGDVQRPLLEAVLLSIRNVVDEISMGACDLHEVAFPFEAPEYADLVRDMFGCEARYGQDWAGLRAPLANLDVKLTRADPATFQIAESICQRELERLTESETYASRVRRALLEKQFGFPSLQVTARRLHMTPRTLHRRLVAEGTSYRELTESVRHTLAIEHLKSGHFGMDEIAYRLGYTDLANFRRAFKRWEKVPPSVYRDRHAQR